MVWKVRALDNSDTVDLGDIAYGDPGVLRYFVIDNICDRLLCCRISPDDKLVAWAEKIVFRSAQEGTDDVDENIPDDGPVYGEDDNLIFYEQEAEDLFEIQPHSKLRFSIFFKPLPDQTAQAKLELTAMTGRINVEDLSPDLDPEEGLNSMEKYVYVNGKVCSSLVKTELSELSFNCCEPLKKYVKDFTVWNCSEIATVIRVRSTNISGVGDPDQKPLLEFSDYESGAPLGSTGGKLDLQSFGHKRIRVTFHPLETGEVDYVVDVDNVRNIENIQSLKIMTSVTIDTPIAGLEVSCGDDLDFGDRFAFNPFPKKIWLRNIHDEPLDIKLSSDITSQIAFELAMRDEEEAVANQHLSTLSDISPTSQVSTAQSSPKSVSQNPRMVPELQPSQLINRLTLESGNMEKKDDADGSPSGNREDNWQTYKRNSLEELTVNPGQTRWLRVWYCPTVNDSEDEKMSRGATAKSGTLQSTSFRLLLRSSSSVSKTIYCKARVCESIVKVNPKEIYLGDCNVQTHRSTVVRIYNYSDLTAFIAVKYVSKCVTASVKDMVIAPRQWYDLLLNYVPRKVNPEYEKQITIVNRRNRRNDSVFILRANVVDRNRVSIHALFYKVLSPTPTNEIDMGTTVEGYPAISVFEVRNITANKLRLGLNASPNVILFLVKRKDSSVFSLLSATKHLPVAKRSGSIRRDLLLSKMDEKAQPLRGGSGEANGEKLQPSQADALIAEIVESLRPKGSIPTYFADAEAERHYVNTQLKPAALLQKASESGIIERTSELVLEGEQTATLIVCFTPLPHKGIRRLLPRFRPIEEKLVVSLLEFNESILKTYRAHDGRSVDVNDISPREVTLSALACRSELEVAQKKLNFGNLNIGEQRSKSLVIHNKAEAPLLYEIEKTRSVASGDLRFDICKTGVVRPYSSKEIPFVFSPSLAGTYKEVVTIENLLDKRDVKTVTVKAEIHRRQHFHMEVISKTYFGQTIAGVPSSGTLRVRITNDSDKTRKFTAEVGPRVLFHGAGWSGSEMKDIPRCVFSIEEQQAADHRSQNEDINSLEMKAEAYRKKGKTSKAEKTMEAIAQLKMKHDNPQSEGAASEQEHVADSKPQSKMHITLRGGDSQILRIKLVSNAESVGKVIHFSISIYESKNKDMQEKIDCTASVTEDTASKIEESPETKSIIHVSPEQLYLTENKLEAIELIPTQLDVDGVVVGANKKTATFRIQNKLVERLTYSIVIPTQPRSNSRSSEVSAARLQQVNSDEPLKLMTAPSLEVEATPSSGELAPEESVPVLLSVSSSAAGKHMQSIVVRTETRDELCEKSLTFNVNSAVKPLIEFQECTVDGALDLGRGAIHPSKQYAIEKRVQLTSVSDLKLRIKARSNLSSQVFVFDENGGPVDALPIMPRGTQIVKICVAPKLELEELSDGTCKKLVGGLHFVLTSEESSKGGETVVVEQTAKFSAFVGISLVDVDRKVLNLGAVSSMRAVLRDQFTITNRSKVLEARLELIPSQKRVRVSRSKLVLRPMSSIVIHTTLACNSVGMCKEHIGIVNDDLPSEVITVPIGAFVDPHEVYFEKSTLNSEGMELIDGMQIYVAPDESESDWRVTHSEPRQDSTQMDIEDAKTHASSDKSLFTARDNAFELGGDVRRVELELQCAGSVKVSAEEEKELRSGQVVNFSAFCLLTSTERVKQSKEPGMGIFKAVRINGLLCFSKIRFVQDAPINLGFIGHNNEWRSVDTEAELENLTSLPTSYSVSSVPPELEILDDSGQGTIEPLSSRKISLRLISEKLRENASGELALRLAIKNDRNPGNLATVVLSSIVTSPLLAFDRLTSLDTWQLILPPMTVPGQETAEEWFRVTNVGEEAGVLEFELESAMPQLEEMFNISISELGSGSAMRTVTLNSGESVGIRVNAELKPAASSSLQLWDSLGRLQTSRVDNEPVPVLSTSSLGMGSGISTESLPGTPFLTRDGSPDGDKGDGVDEEVLDQFCAVLWSMKIKYKTGELEQPSEIIKILARLKPGPSVSASPRILTLITDGTAPSHDVSDDAGTNNELASEENILLMNRWTDKELKFRVEVVGFEEDIEISVEPVKGLIAAGGSSDLKVSLKSGSLAMKYEKTAPLHGTILIHDLDRSVSAPAMVGIAIAFGTSLSAEGRAREESGLESEPVLLAAPGSPRKPVILEALSYKRGMDGENLSTGESIGMEERLYSGSHAEDSDVFSLPASVTRKPKISQKAMVVRRDFNNHQYCDDVIILKGCSSLPGSGLRYETNVGQVTVGKQLAPWKLTLESSAEANLEYKIHRLRSFDSEQGWFSLSRNGGILEKGKIQGIEISFQAEKVGVYYTYLLIENRENPSDLKTVRVSMEVVADGSASRSMSSGFFSVLCDGGIQNLEYSMVTFDHVYRHRSFFICNHSDIELEFLLSHDVPPAWRTEVNFSSTNATLRKVNSLLVNPNQKRRVFLYFRPRMELEDLPKLKNDLPTTKIVRKFNVYINCRLVKDHQETIEVTSYCRAAQLKLTRTDFLFDLSSTEQSQGIAEHESDNFRTMMSPVVQKRDPEAAIHHALVGIGRELEETLEVHNLFPSELEYVVKNDSIFFISDCVSEGSLADHRDFVKVSFRLNITRLLERLSFLVKEKYVEEHISVYNKRLPDEYYWVRLRISFGAASEFSAVMHSRTFTFSILEELVMIFLQKFSVFWSGLRRPRVAGAGADSVEIAMASASGDNDSVQQMLAKIREKQRTASTAPGLPSFEEWLERLDETLNSKDYRDLLFEAHYVTDELVYFALRHGTANSLRIATTLFSFVFKHNVFTSILQNEAGAAKAAQLIAPWAGQLRYFLSYFPDKADYFKGLLELDKRLSKGHFQ